MDDSNDMADTIGETAVPASLFIADQDGDNYSESVLIVCAISCFLSILGSSVIFGTYMVMPEIRNFTRKLIVCFTLADLLTAVGILIGTAHYVFAKNTGSDVICRVQSYITTYSSLVSFLLTIMAAVHIYTIVVKQVDFSCRRRLVLFNLVSWTIPGVVIAVAGSRGVLGTTKATGTGPWCWIESGEQQLVMWQLVTGKGWEITCNIVITSLYLLLAKHVLSRRHGHETFRTFHSSLRNEDQNFLYVWFMFFVIRIWGTIRFFNSIIQPETMTTTIPMNILLHLQAFGDPAQAFCNCILFCFLDKTVRRRLCCREISGYKELKESYPGNDKTTIPAHQNSSSWTRYGSMNSHRDDSEDAYSYDSPVSTPCVTPRLSPASFISINSDEQIPNE